MVYVWAAMILIGGLSSAVGTWLDRWFGEYIGLWPLAMTLAVYAVALAATSAARGTTPAAALLFAGFSLLFVARWKHVAMIRREAEFIRGEIRDRE